MKAINKYMIKDRKLLINPKKSVGMKLFDEYTGKYFTDYCGQFGSLPVTPDHRMLKDPAFLKKMKKAAVHNPTNSDFLTKGMLKFCDRFHEHFMDYQGFKHLFFISGGTLAVENGLKVAFDWKIRTEQSKGREIYENELEVIHFTGAFHGRSGYCLSLTNTTPDKTAGFPKFDWPRFRFPVLKYPGHSFERSEIESLVMSELNSYLERRHNKVAAIIVEPIQGEGGDCHMSSSFWQYLRRMADHYDALLIADEVQTGGYTTGRPWAYEHFAPSRSNGRELVTPDLVCFGKKFQNSGIIAGSRVDSISNNVFKVPSRINSTFGGNYIDFIRAEKYLEIIETDRLYHNVQEVSKELLRQLTFLTPAITNVRGSGFMIAFDVKDTETRDDLIAFLFEKKLIVLPCGSNSLRIRPPLNVSINDFDELMCTLAEWGNIHINDF